ncbi:hypothetical protein E1218_21960 [Kribbella turkmenica]|uniref:DUF4145 domain-containing protein n=1 Tax=Kribbella turkmenica TaxID=2530375 RepID=A0A4R4WT21_9ACTN|nr:hypothetical protein [Kribbella turkmenica]TDD20769.1 hypothetical protein E1218_21960 [Kribbella turkmenica]
MPLYDSTTSIASEDESGSLTRATQHVAEMRAQLRDHQWEQCMVTCRRVLGQIPRLADIPSSKSVAAVAASTRSPEQRWAAIYWDMWSLANATHHDDSNTAGLTWTRDGAEAVLLAAAGLLKRYTASR